MSLINYKVLTVIQARLGSSRLPGKVMLSVLGKPLLLRMVERVAASNLAGTVVVATTIKPEDDKIEKLCKENNIHCFRGDPENLLDRHYQAAKFYKADAVVKIPSDCPLIDPRIIDRVIGYYLLNADNYDYVSNLHPATYPDGNDVEIMSFQTLETAWKEADRKLELEHTTPYIWENPHKFNIGNVTWDFASQFRATHRWTIDYEEDYIFVCKIYNELYHKDPQFSLYDILALLDEKKYIYNINSKYAGEYWYKNHLNELNHIEDYKNQKIQYL